MTIMRVRARRDPRGSPSMSIRAERSAETFTQPNSRGPVMLVEYLWARLDEREAAAHGRGTPGAMGIDGVEVATYGDSPSLLEPHTMLCGERQLYWTDPCHCEMPSQVLADVTAMRTIINLHDGDELGLHVCEDALADESECRTLRALAQAFAGREDFPVQWRNQDSLTVS